MMDIENYEVVPPKASSITESLRSIGYSIETAVADLIDNSISADAHHISIFGEFKGTNTALFILDDGNGMDEDTLKNAMRLGSSSPTESRKTNDLGRFGLGLKTASFSQCRRLTVISKKEKSLVGRFWDLDIINETNEWRLRSDVDETFIKLLEHYQHGTLVVWEKLDRVISDKDSDAERRFNNKKNIIRDHLGLTFHRFIESGQLQISIGGVTVQPWDPFLSHMDYSYKKELPPVVACNGTVTIKGWIMPHRMYFTDPEYKKAGYNKGWTNMQGFYVYRANRLLVAGGWLGLSINGLPIRHEHHYDLARICVDISNEHDFDWDIDIKKSRATPPDYLRNSLENVAKETRLRAYETYVFRGVPEKKKSNNGKPLIPLWTSAMERNKKLYYKINLDYPYIKDLFASIGPDAASKVSKLLKLIAETIPVQNVDFHVGKQDHLDFSTPYEDSPEELKEMMQALVNSFVSQGFSEEEAIEQVKIILQSNK